MTTKLLARPDLRPRFLYAVLFAFLFSFMGWAIPEVYFRYLDKTEYLVVQQPVSVDRKLYAPCERTRLTTKLEAKVDVNVKSLTQLILTNEKGDKIRASEVIEAEAPILADDEHIVSGWLNLPCDLEEGLYYWQGNATFEVNGNEKTISFISETFTVEISEEEPEEKEATPSAQTTLRQPFFIPSSPAPTAAPSPQPTSQPNNSTVIINNQPPAQPTPQPTPAPQPSPTPNDPGNGNANPPVQICVPIVGCIFD